VKDAKSNHLNSNDLERRRPRSTTRGTRASDAADVVHSLRRLFKALQVYSKAVLKQTGLSGPQVWALTILAQSRGLALHELAAAMFAHPSTVSGIVERLVQRGAVRRVPDTRDRRAVSLSVTAAGRRLLRSSPPPVQVGLRGALLRMPAARLDQLRESLATIVRATETSGLAAPFFEIER